jgi:hypothetical protein
MKKFNLFVATAAMFTSSLAFGQIKAPQPSPEATLTQAVGLTNVEIVYSRPGAKGRTVFGDVVPFGEIWRTGANSSTKITLSDNVKIGGQDVPAGTYAIYTIPGKEEWTIILHKYLENWGAGGYDQTQDLARFTVKPTMMTENYESFTIDFASFASGKAMIDMRWENTKVSFAIETPTDVMMEKQIKAQLIDGPSAGTYASGAGYYLEKGEKLDLAATWIVKAIELRPEAFWYLHTEAKILAKQGKKKEAIAAAEKSMEMAKANKEGDFGYVGNNERLIKELKAGK